MAISTIIAALMLAQSAVAVDPIDVGYTELSRNNPEGAISRIEANRAIDSQDPAALINLGAAYARMGLIDDARECYTRAITSEERYDLQLADGSWMDSRRAARQALEALDRPQAIATR
jgi:tetratricopeptide (TPR) repeat protein